MLIRAYGKLVTTLTILPFALIPRRSVSTSSDSSSLPETALAPAVIETSPAESRRFAAVLRSNLSFAPEQGLSAMVKESQNRIYSARSHAYSQIPRPDRLPTTTLVHALLKRHRAKAKAQSTSNNHIGVPETPTLESQVLRQLFDHRHQGRLDAAVLRLSTQKALSRTIARTTIHHCKRRNGLETDAADYKALEGCVRELMHLPEDLLYRILWDFTAVPIHQESADRYTQLWADLRRNLSNRSLHPRIRQLRQNLDKALKSALSRQTHHSFEEQKDLQAAYQRLLEALQHSECFRPAAISALSRFGRKHIEADIISPDWDSTRRQLRARIKPLLSDGHDALHNTLSALSKSRACQMANALVQFAFRQHPNVAPQQVAHILRTMHSLGIPPDKHMYTTILQLSSDLRPTVSRDDLASWAAAAFDLRPLQRQAERLHLPPLPSAPAALDPPAVATYLRFLRKQGDARKVLQLVQEVRLPQHYLKLMQHGRLSSQAAERSYTAEFYNEVIAASVGSGHYSRALEFWRAAVLNENLVKMQMDAAHHWVLPTRTYSSALAAVAKLIDMSAKANTQDTPKMVKKYRDHAWRAFRRLRFKNCEDTDSSIIHQKPRMNRYVLRLLLDIFKQRAQVPQDYRWFEVACQMQSLGLPLSSGDKHRLMQEQMTFFDSGRSTVAPLWFANIQELLEQGQNPNYSISNSAQWHTMLAELYVSVLKGLAGSQAERRRQQVHKGLRYPQLLPLESQKLLEKLLRLLYQGQSARWVEVVRDLEDRGWIMPSASSRQLSSLEEDW